MTENRRNILRGLLSLARSRGEEISACKYEDILSGRVPDSTPEARASARKKFAAADRNRAARQAGNTHDHDHPWAHDEED